MSRERGPGSARVVVTTRARADALRVIDEAGALAHALGAELAGIFVQEADLLRLAALPITQEIGSASGDVREIHLDATIRMMRRHADEVRGLIARVASALDLPWSFSVTSGDVVDAALVAAAGPDVVLLAPARSALQHMLGSGPARPGEARPREARPAAPSEGSPVGERALAATAPGPPRGIPDVVTLGDLRGLVGHRALVVSIGSFEGREVELRELLAAADRPVVLVR